MHVQRLCPWYQSTYKSLWSAGALEGVDAIFGLHVWPFLPSGTLGSRAGPLMGACQQFQVTIKGRGGHAAMPHTVIDPIVASSHVIIALQVTSCNATLISNSSIHMCRS